jgi:perosamine synthetase
MTTTRASKLALAGGPPAVPRSPRSLRRWPDITDDDRRAVAAVLDRDIWGIHAREVTMLEDEFAEYCGASYCVAVPTGTAAVRCAVVAAGVRRGDEVIVPAFSYVASALPVVLGGADVVFCDIDPSTYCIDVEKAEKLITPRTRAIMAVHIHGLVTDMSRLEALAERHGLALICDAAQAAGATEHGRTAGTFGRASSFSLNGQKPWQAGEGGLITCDDEDVHTAIQRFACLGEDRPRDLEPGLVRASWSRWVGDQFRMNEMTAALARSQLRRLDEYLACARENAGILAQLADLPGVTPAFQPDGSESSHYRFRVRLDPAAHGRGDRSPVEFRDRVLYALQREGVPVDTWQLHPLPAHPVFRRDDYEPYRPGREDDPLRSWHFELYPEAVALLDNSITVGADPFPLHVQSAETMRLCVTAFEKVIENMDYVLRADYEPVRTAPAILESEV